MCICIPIFLPGFPLSSSLSFKTKTHCLRSRTFEGRKDNLENFCVTLGKGNFQAYAKHIGQKQQKEQIERADLLNSDNNIDQKEDAGQRLGEENEQEQRGLGVEVLLERNDWVMYTGRQDLRLSHQRLLQARHHSEVTRAATPDGAPRRSAGEVSVHPCVD